MVSQRLTDFCINMHAIVIYRQFALHQDMSEHVTAVSFSLKKILFSALTLKY